MSVNTEEQLKLLKELAEKINKVLEPSTGKQNTEEERKDIMNNILAEANDIINNRTQEKERMYGPFSEGMERAAQIASASTGKQIDPEDVYIILIALKLSRHSYNYKRDNLLDLVAYVGGLDNYINEKIKN